MSEEKSWQIYCLKDPRTGEIRYVGQTNQKNISTRLRQHIYFSRIKSTQKDQWVKELLDEGLKPICEVLEAGTGDSAPAEKRWIALFREQGLELKNSTIGGSGTVGRKWPEGLRERMREINLERWRVMSDEEREQHAKASQNRVLTAESIKRIGDSHRGKKLSAEHRRKVSEAGKGRIATPQARANASAVRLGKKRPPEMGRKVSAALTGRKQSPELLAKLSAIRKGKKHSPEHCQAISAGLRASTKLKGRPCPWKGKKRGPMSEECRQKISAALKGITPWNKGKKKGESK